MEGSKPAGEDGAGEKLFDDTIQNKSPKENNDVKFISEGPNGESKMDCDMRRAFVGMGKEELMKFASDPFWVRTRWFLFVLFWISWIAMLVGAIAIVVYSPKCSAPTKDLFKDSVIYKINLRTFKNSGQYNRTGYLKGLKDNLDYFEYLGVDTIMLNSLMEGTERDPNTIKDFTKIDSMYGSFEILKDLAKEMKQKGINLIMTFIPNYSSDTHIWFRNSVANIEPYNDYYVWAPGSYSSEGSHIPPNNWVSVYGNSAWTWVDERKQFYLHQFKPYQPDLNFLKQEVVEYFKNVFTSWLNNGLSGFYLDDVIYLIESPKLENETANQLGSGTHTDYDFYNHVHTTYLQQSEKIIHTWAEVIKEHSGYLYVSDLQSETYNNSFITNHILKFKKFINATDFHNSVQKILKTSNPTWQWKCESKLHCPEETVAKSLLTIFILLPGTVIINAGEEISWPNPDMPWSSEPNNETNSFQLNYFLDATSNERADPHSSLNTFKKLLKLRETLSISEGKHELAVLNSTVFAFTRIHKNDASYIVITNFGEDERTIDCQVFKGISTDSELEVIHSSKDVEQIYAVNVKIKSDKIKMKGNSNIVLKFTPVEEVTVLVVQNKTQDTHT